MPFVPERIGLDARRQLERAFRLSVATITVVGVGFPLGPVAAQGLVNDLWNYFLFLLSKLFEVLLIFTGKFVVLLVNAVIDVAQYNDFVNAAPVLAGWPLVRDVVNMFFIVVLLVTAFATIVQYNKFKYKEILPKLLLMAILVNFSKTLIGLLIDFSQIVMLTFVNGFKAAAAGNFTQALKLDKVLAFAQQQSELTREQNQSLSENNSMLLDIVLAEMLGMFMVGTAAVVLLIMLLYLVVRVVGLWIALIMSPAAFFASALSSTPLSKGIAFVSSTFWPRLGAFLSGGPIMAFFLWLTLATVQTGGFGNFTPTAANQAEQEQLSFFATQVGNAQEVATFLVGVVMLVMGVEAAVSIAGQASQTLGKAAGRIRSSGMAATRFMTYGGLLAGGAAAARGVRRATGAGARYADSRLDVTGRIGRRIQTVGSYAPVVGTAIGAAGAALTGIRTRERQRFGKGLETATANLSAGQRIGLLEQYAKGGNADKRRAALVALGKLESSTDGMKALSGRFEKEGISKKGLEKDSPELKAFAERQTRQRAASRLDELESIASETNDQDVIKYVREEREKRPDLVQDLEGRKNLISGMVDEGEDGLRKIGARAWEDPAFIRDFLIASNALSNGQEVNMDAFALKKAMEKGGRRGEMIQAFLNDAKKAAGENGNVVDAIVSNKVSGMYVKGGNDPVTGKTRWQLVPGGRLDEIEKTAVVAGGGSAVSGQAAPRRNESVISAARDRIGRFRPQGEKGADEVRRAQYEGMLAGARMNEIYDVDAGGTFKTPEDHRHFTQNVKAVVQQGASNVNAYSNLDFSVLQRNPTGRNEVRSAFSAHADIDHLRTAWTAAGTSNPRARTSIATAIGAIHEEGSRVEQQLADYNTKHPEARVNTAQVLDYARAGNEEQVRLALGDFAHHTGSTLTMDEIRSVVKKQEIDGDAVLKTFKTAASPRTARAAAAGRGQA